VIQPSEMSRFLTGIKLSCPRFFPPSGVPTFLTALFDCCVHPVCWVKNRRLVLNEVKPNVDLGVNPVCWVKNRRLVLNEVKPNVDLGVPGAWLAPLHRVSIE
jgi:hypothetical protein